MTKEERLEINQTRRKALMDYLSNSTNAVDTVQSICDALPEYYSVKVTEGNYSNCPKIYEDIIALNSDPMSGPIIVVDNNTFKIATKEEATLYIMKIQNLALSYWSRYWSLYNKATMNGQLTLFEEECCSLVPEEEDA